MFVIKKKKTKNKHKIVKKYSNYFQPIKKKKKINIIDENIKFVYIQ